MAGFTLEQYEALTAAIASGARSVSYAGESVTYHSLQEMLDLQEIMAVQLGLKKATLTVFPNFNKGLFKRKK